jgi:photosystem II stability/assembly factor-like uncharacterized protein
VSAGPQGSIGPVFYRTADGGRDWTPIRQGIRFGESATDFDFVTPDAGFGWLPGTEATRSATPVMYQTSDSGRRWTAFVPRLS